MESTTSTHPPIGERGGFKEQFFHQFQQESNALQAQMDQLETAGTPSSGTMIEECLARIARLSTSVQDASSALPTYDQRTYSDGIRALSERLQRLRSAYAPKKKFAFKTAAARGHDPMLPSSTSVAPPVLSSATMPQPPRPSVRAAVDELHIIANRNRTHVTLPTATASRTISLADLGHCIVQPSVPSPQYTSLTLNTIDSCLLVLPPTAGPAHMTNMTNSTLILHCRQFRLHSCRNVDVFLHCASRPIIEDCEGIRFAPLSAELIRLVFGEEKDDGGDGENPLNQWDQVDDFKWIRADEQSPNWKVLRGDEGIEGHVWRDVRALAEAEEVSAERVEEILKKTLPVR